ncbi:MAG: helix-turn-helix domain-containing protein [Clostridia bacterium]|nr:helix-turn-helix domain-containing protein [Clostridia bacterium]
MKVSYKPLFKLLVDKNMRKKDLCARAGVSTASVTKMGKCGHVTTEVLGKICFALNCKVDDILEFVYLDEE